jgi:predicted PurR-regulated permease PerM
MALCWMAYQARHILLLLYVCVILAIGFRPIVRLIERQKLVPAGRGRGRLSRPAAILVLYLLILGVLAIVVVSSLPPLVEQGVGLARLTPHLLDRLQQWLVDLQVIDHKLTIQEMFRTAPPSGDAVNTVVSTVFGAVSGIIGGIFGFVTVLMLTYYLIIEGEEIVEFSMRLLPVERRGRAREIWRGIAEKVSGWLIGQLFLSLTIGATTAVALWVFGLPYVFVLAVIAAIGELVPMIGPVLAAVPAVAVAFTVSPWVAAGVALFFLVQQQVENVVLVPRIMARQVGVSAVTVLVSLAVGATLLGIVGALLAVPTAAIVQVMVHEWLVYADDRPEEPAG